MSIDEELLMDEEENRREAAFIKEQLPSELKEKFTDDDLLWMMDSIVEYYFESGVLESDDDEVEIDLDEVATAVCRQAVKEGRPALDPQEVFFVVKADLDFQEQNC